MASRLIDFGTKLWICRLVRLCRNIAKSSTEFVICKMGHFNSNKPRRPSNTVSANFASGHTAADLKRFRRPHQKVVLKVSFRFLTRKIEKRRFSTWPWFPYQIKHLDGHFEQFELPTAVNLQRSVFTFIWHNPDICRRNRPETSLTEYLAYFWSWKLIGTSWGQNSIWKSLYFPIGSNIWFALILEKWIGRLFMFYNS